MIRLNLGCGNYIDGNAINIDVRYLPGVNTVADVGSLPIRNDCVDEIIALDVFEHVSHLKSQELLNHWVAKLKEGGLLFIQMPSLDRIIQYYSGADSIDKIEIAIRCIFGDQEYEENQHRTIGNPQLMDHYLRQAGITGEIQFQLDNTNIRFKARK